MGGAWSGGVVCSGGVCSQGGAWTQGGAWSRGVPGGRPPPQTATAAGGTYPTGIHSCFLVNCHLAGQLFTSFVSSNNKNAFSSRMRTVRCSGRLAGGGLSAKVGWYLPRGVCARGVYAREGVCLPVGVCTHPPIPLSLGQNSWHTLVKTLPFRNYCCGR